MCVQSNCNYVKHVRLLLTVQSSIKNMSSNSKSSKNKFVQFNPSIYKVLRIKLPKNSIYTHFELSWCWNVWIKWNFEFNCVWINSPIYHWKDRKVEEIMRKVWIKWNFELTVFELTGPNLYWCSEVNLDCFTDRSNLENNLFLLGSELHFTIETPVKQKYERFFKNFRKHLPQPYFQHSWL